MLRVGATNLQWEDLTFVLVMVEGSDVKSRVVTNLLNRPPNFV